VALSPPLNLMWIRGGNRLSFWRSFTQVPMSLRIASNNNCVRGILGIALNVERTSGNFEGVTGEF
jgi:hypothetical protein